MFFSLVGSTGSCCGKPINPINDESSAKLLLGLSIVDIVVTISSLVLGILGLLSVIPIPPPAAYALLGVSLAFIVAKIMTTVLMKDRTTTGTGDFQSLELEKIVWSRTFSCNKDKTA